MTASDCVFSEMGAASPVSVKGLNAPSQDDVVEGCRWVLKKKEATAETVTRELTL
jgi:hypothetical protein